MVLEVVAAVIILSFFIRLGEQGSQRATARAAGSGTCSRRCWCSFATRSPGPRSAITTPTSSCRSCGRCSSSCWAATCSAWFLGRARRPARWRTTGALALITFLVVIGAGHGEARAGRLLEGQVPHMDLPPVLAILLKPMIFVIEVIGLFIKHFVLGRASVGQHDGRAPGAGGDPRRSSRPARRAVRLVWRDARQRVSAPLR